MRGSPVTDHTNLLRAAYLQRVEAVRETAEALQRNAGYILDDLDRERLPRMRSCVADALKLARTIEAIEALAEVEQAAVTAGKDQH